MSEGCGFNSCRHSTAQYGRVVPAHADALIEHERVTS